MISSDIILTEETPERLAEIGWTGGEAISDSQVMIHYYRRTPRRADDVRQGRLGHRAGGPAPGQLRPPRGPRPATWRRTSAASTRRSPTCGSSTTGAGRSTGRRTGCRSSAAWAATSTSSTASAGAATASARRCSAARILASLALAERDEWSTSPFVGERAGRFPPDPVRYTGAHVVRSAVVRMERAVRGGS